MVRYNEDAEVVARIKEGLKKRMVTAMSSGNDRR